MLRILAILALVLVASTASAQPQRPPLEWIRQEPENPRLIVFVHGILGDTDTWASGGRRWPNIVANDPLFEDMNIAVYTYGSAAVGGGFTARGLANQLANELRLPSANIDKYESVVFVAHSLGGILARQYVLLEAARARVGQASLVGKIKALFLFATPMDGSSIANVVGVAPGASPLIEDLRRLSRAGGSFFARLRSEWREAKLGLTIPSYCAFETKKTGIPFLAAKVVESESAEHLCSSDLAEVEEDHFNIVKPVNPNRFYSHTLLSNWYRDVFPSAGRVRPHGDAPVMIAKCDSDRYGPEFNDAISREILALTKSEPRQTRPLPRDWRPSHRPLLWGDGVPPKVVVIHLSCFQNGPDTAAPGPNLERTEDFVRFLSSLQHESVKVLVYSQAFAAGSQFLRRYVLADEFIKNGRMITFQTTRGVPFSTDPVQQCKFAKDLVTLLEITNGKDDRC